MYTCTQVSLNCAPPEILVGENNEPQDLERHSCSIGNPFSGPGSIRLRVQLNPRVGLVGSENDVSINFTVSSINPEMPANINDNSNFALTQMSVEARADVSIDDGYVVFLTSLSLSSPLSLLSLLSFLHIYVINNFIFLHSYQYTVLSHQLRYPILTPLPFSMKKTLSGMSLNLEHLLMSRS